MSSLETNGLLPDAPSARLEHRRANSAQNVNRKSWHAASGLGNGSASSARVNGSQPDTDMRRKSSPPRPLGKRSSKSVLGDKLRTYSGSSGLVPVRIVLSMLLYLQGC